VDSTRRVALKRSARASRRRRLVEQATERQLDASGSSGLDGRLPHDPQAVGQLLVVEPEGW
jgi:hypothetical protein